MKSIPASYVDFGWLAPDGKLYFVPSVCAHETVARELLADGQNWASDKLQEDGWVHVSVEATKYLYNSDGVRPTQPQLDSIWDMFVDARKQGVKPHILDCLKRWLNIA